ncbi:MAG: hypothetical protein ACRDNF_00395, partial [Streptosporangiaceae bacterium]
MLRSRRRASLRPSRRASLRPKGAVLAACALAVSLGASGCAAASAGQAPPIQATNAYVPLPITPGTTYAY